MTWYVVVKLDTEGYENYMEFESEEAALDEAEDTWNCNQGEYEAVAVLEYSIEDGCESKELICEYC